MKSLKWTSQNCCEPKFIEALAALMLLNWWRFQTSAVVQRRDASCSGICDAGAAVLFVSSTGRRQDSKILSDYKVLMEVVSSK